MKLYPYFVVVVCEGKNDASPPLLYPQFRTSDPVSGDLKGNFHQQDDGSSKLLAKSLGIR